MAPRTVTPRLRWIRVTRKAATRISCRTSRSRHRSPKWKGTLQLLATWLAISTSAFTPRSFVFAHLVGLSLVLAIVRLAVPCMHHRHLFLNRESPQTACHATPPVEHFAFLSSSLFLHHFRSEER